MNILSFEKVLYQPKHLAAIQEDRMIFPLHVTVSLGNFCNHRCRWCTAYEYQKEKATIMDYEKLLSFLTRACNRGLKAVTYVGNGEPTIYPHFRELISKVKALGLEQGMFTNGYALNHYEADILQNFTWIRVSLDAGSEAVHEKMHDVHNHFGKIISNIQSLVAHKTSKLPTIGVQYAVHHENLEDLPSAARQCKALGVDYFSVKPVFNRGSVGERIEKNRLTYEEITPVVESIQSLSDEHFSLFYRPHQILSHAQEKTVFNYERCLAGFFNVNVYEDETIVYCGPHHVVVGKITDDLDDVEKSIMRVSKKLNLSHCPAGCRYHELNHFIASLSCADDMYAKRHFNFI